MHTTSTWRQFIFVQLALAQPFNSPIQDTPEASSLRTPSSTSTFTPFEGKIFGVVIILMVLLPIAIAIIGAYIEHRFGDGSTTVSQRKKSAHWERVASRLRKKRGEQLDGPEVESRFKRFLRRWIYVTPERYVGEQAAGEIQSPFGGRGYGIDDEPISNTIPPGGGTMVPPGPQTLAPMRNMRPPQVTVPPAGPSIPPMPYALEPRRFSVPPPEASNALRPEVISSPRVAARELRRPSIAFDDPKGKKPEKQKEPGTAARNSPQLSPTGTERSSRTRRLTRKHRKSRVGVGEKDSIARQRLRHAVEKSFGEMSCLVGSLHNPDIAEARDRAMTRKKSMSSHL